MADLRPFFIAPLVRDAPMNREVEVGEKSDCLAAFRRMAERPARPIEHGPTLGIIGFEIGAERALLAFVVAERKLARATLENEIERILFGDLERHLALDREHARLLDTKAQHRDDVVEAITYPADFAVRSAREFERFDVYRLALSRTQVERVFPESDGPVVPILGQVVDGYPH